MDKSLETLSDEHKNILEVIEFLSRECDALRNGKKIDTALLNNIVRFIRDYADKFHHAKEEKILFDKMQKCGSETSCSPVDQMLYEHNLGREFIAGLDKGIVNADKNEIIKNAEGYIQLLREHISKEDNILYPMADQSMSKVVKVEMAKEFKKTDKILDKQKRKALLLMKEFK